MNTRIGTGYDAHRLVEGRPLTIGGVVIPFEKGLGGYSDADVLCHAIGDAILGALAERDLGAHFPPGDKKWLNISSLVLLGLIRAIMVGHGASIVNVDSTLIMERPMIAPHVPEMRARIARALGITPEQVSVKATTNEGMGWIGRGEGAAAQAVVLLQMKG